MPLSPSSHSHPAHAASPRDSPRSSRSSSGPAGAMNPHRSDSPVLRADSGTGSGTGRDRNGKKLSVRIDESATTGAGESDFRSTPALHQHESSQQRPWGRGQEGEESDDDSANIAALLHLAGSTPHAKKATVNVVAAQLPARRPATAPAAAPAHARAAARAPDPDTSSDTRQRAAYLKKVSESRANFIIPVKGRIRREIKSHKKIITNYLSTYLRGLLQ